LKEIGWVGHTKVIGALRAYAVRHGNGPFVTEIERPVNELHSFQDEHNVHNEWQGCLRIGWFDAVATHYAMRAEWESSFDHCGYSSPPGIHSLAITNVDRMERWLREGHDWCLCTGYEWRGGGPLVFEPGCLFPHHPGKLTEDLFQARPSYDRSGNTVEDLLVAIESLLHCPIEIASQGPTRDGKSWSGSLAEPHRK
jgi:adenylosuccinate synthase